MKLAREEQVLEILKKECGNLLIEEAVSNGFAIVRVAAENLLKVCSFLRDDPSTRCDLLLSVTAVDYMDTRADRFELVYHLLSLSHGYRVRIKVAISEAKPQLSSVCALWPGANFMEREVWDMYGVVFDGHPDLRRILMYDEFKGHPLRKDYPLQGKQPRIPLRSPEVENTARHMQRPALVKIGANKSSREARV